MKKITLLLLTTFMVTFLLISIGCAKPQILGVDASIPAAQGSVKFTKATNGNVGIKLILKHLANPNNLTPKAFTYVVWIKSNEENSVLQNIGALVVDKNLNGKLQTVTPMHNFELFVTAETSAEIEAPTGEKLLWANHQEANK